MATSLQECGDSLRTSTQVKLWLMLLAASAAFGQPTPVREINDAVVFTVNEPTGSDDSLDLARQVGSEVLIRGWFKWRQAPRLEPLRWVPRKAHEFGALFGGGITCSALYDGENGLTHEQLLDMATRGSDGKLVDAWNQPGIRHGSLSSPAYLDYLFRWCREQIDAGADCLFMDEINAALSEQEGYDDYSRADFKVYLSMLGKTNDTDRALWQQFRRWRDDRAWKSLTDRIRVYAKEHNRTIVISGNGLVKYVDLQVLGVWGAWITHDGHIDLRGSQLPHWRSLVQHGRVLAGKRVPVVLFHDWGFGNPPFPWLAVPPADRKAWIRTRGAEIYAAGAFFAFPVLGPFGCDANKDGTLPFMTQQAVFYKNHRDIYLRADYVGAESLRSATPNLSLAAWTNAHAVLLHVINRNPQPQTNVTVELPLDHAPVSATVISPDFDGERPATYRLNGGLGVTLDRLDAYSVVTLRYETLPTVSHLRDPARTPTTHRWERATLNEFRVLPDGLIEDADELSGFLQGTLHPHLRNPPTFLVNAAKPGTLAAHVRGVATLGARLEFRVDGATKQVVELPDRDGRNDALATEYDQTFHFPFPAGQHRLTLDNTGGDWAYMTWIAFQ